MLPRLYNVIQFGIVRTRRPAISFLLPCKFHPSFNTSRKCSNTITAQCSDRSPQKAYLDEGVELAGNKYPWDRRARTPAEGKWTYPCYQRPVPPMSQVSNNYSTIAQQVKTSKAAQGVEHDSYLSNSDSNVGTRVSQSNIRDDDGQRLDPILARSFARLRGGDMVQAQLDADWAEEARRLFPSPNQWRLEARLELIMKAKAMDELLALLIGPCLTIEDARLELKWLREHVEEQKKSETGRGNELKAQASLKELCEQRHSGVPLQYLMRSAYFAELKLECRPGVLIPRSDTADIVMDLLDRIKTGSGSLPRKLRILDLCSGSGCIALLLAHSFPYQEASTRGNKELEIVGVDISDAAIALAKDNQQLVLQQREPEIVARATDAIRGIKFIKADVLDTAISDTLGPEPFDIVVSNPPYVSLHGYQNSTSLSVRRFEPKNALIPPQLKEISHIHRANTFYPHILHIARNVGAKVVVLELGSLKQQLQVSQWLMGAGVSETVTGRSLLGENWIILRRRHSEFMTDDGSIVSRPHPCPSILGCHKDAAGWFGTC